MLPFRMNQPCHGTAFALCEVEGERISLLLMVTRTEIDLNARCVMKIQSQDLKMQSQHTFSQSYEESEFSFMTFLQPANVQEPEEIEPEKPLEISSHTTISELIAALMDSLQRRKNSNLSQDENSSTPNRFTSVFSFKQRYQESESMSFSTLGHITTEDSEININLNFSMSRSFMLENQIDIYNSFDPLVINLDGLMPELSSDTFSFDLDNDGEHDQISKLASGNGFLAFDRNEDGKINQGSELFGTRTGNGFAELAEYDKDHNDWIDENDSIFNKLRIWLKNEDTKERELIGLGEAGIGAIYLNATTSEFTYKSESNEVLGELKGCSFYLNENGTCGNISQIDLSDQSKKEEPLSQMLQA